MSVCLTLFCRRADISALKLAIQTIFAQSIEQTFHEQTIFSHK